MTTRTSRWTTDLLVVLAMTALATGAVLLGVGGSLLGTALVAPFVVFLPGYALVSALFPDRRDGFESSDEETVTQPGSVAESLSPAARLGLASVASIALLPAVVLVVNFALGGVHVVTSFAILAALTVLLTLLALVRRYRLPAHERFGVPPTSHLIGAATRPFRRRKRNLATAATFEPTSRRGLLLNVALLASVVVLLSSVAVAYTYPAQGEQFTELYLVTQSDNGEFVASGYPTDFSVGQSRPVYAAVANHEGDTQTYTLVATLQRVDRTPNGTTVTREEELTRVTRTVADGETVRIEHDLQPTFGGGRLRVQYLLYRGEAPADPSTETAYRSVHLWITVAGGSSGGQ